MFLKQFLYVATGLEILYITLFILYNKQHDEIVTIII